MILTSLNSFARSKKWMKRLVVFFANYFEYFLIVLFIVSFLMLREGWLLIGALVSGLFARVIINETIYFFWKRERPFEYSNSIERFVKSSKNPSFPSGHASFYFGLSSFIFLHDFNLGVFFLLGSLLIVLARALGGIHWISDILAGIFIGILSSFIVNLWI